MPTQNWSASRVHTNPRRSHHVTDLSGNGGLSHAAPRSNASYDCPWYGWYVRSPPTITHPVPG